MAETSTDVVIVGGGPAGLALALGLARRGHSVTVLERQAGPRPQTGPRVGFLLQPNGLEALHTLGVLEQVQAGGIVHHTVGTYGPGDHHLVTADYRLLDHPFSYAVAVGPGVLVQALLGALRGLPGVALHRGAEFKDVLRRDGCVVGVRAVVDGQERELSARLVVGADGAQSPVRGALGLRAPARRYPDSYLLTSFARPPWLNEARTYLGPGLYMGAIPFTTDGVYCFFMVWEKSFDEVKQAGLERLHRSVERLAPSLAPLWRTVDLWDKMLYTPTWRLWCDTWVVDGAALLGDAVHSVHPHTAQGINLGLAEAMTLAGVAGAALRAGDTSRGALLSYEQARKPWAHLQLKLGDERVWTFGTRSRLLASWRDMLLRRSAHKPGVLRGEVARTAGVSLAPMTWKERLQLLGVVPGG